MFGIMLIKNSIFTAIAFLILLNCDRNKDHTNSNKIYVTNKFDTIIVGVWGTSPNENANFEILKDSIYYLESNKYYSYKLDDSTFTCFMDDGDTLYTNIIRKCVNDTLIMFDVVSENVSTFIKL